MTREHFGQLTRREMLTTVMAAAGVVVSGKSAVGAARSAEMKVACGTVRLLVPIRR